MTEIELNKICEANPDCGCKCIKCPIFGKYIKSQMNG